MIEKLIGYVMQCPKCKNVYLTETTLEFCPDDKEKLIPVLADTSNWRGWYGSS